MTFKTGLQGATLTVLAAILLPAISFADDYTITLKDHEFSPQTLEIPAHQKVTLKVKNLQKSPAEFESSDLHSEKVVAANGGEISVLVGPLDKGSYKYEDDFHDESTGVIVVK